MSEGGVRLVEITLTVPDALEVIAELATDDAFAARGSIVGAGTVLSGGKRRTRCSRERASSCPPSWCPR